MCRVGGLEAATHCQPLLHDDGRATHQKKSLTRGCAPIDCQSVYACHRPDFQAATTLCRPSRFVCQRLMLRYIPCSR